MASELKVDKFTGVTTAGSIVVTGEGNSTTTNLQQGLLKVWVNFDGSASGAASRDSLNVSGMTDNGTGDYVVSISNDMANANYSCTGSTGDFDGVSNDYTIVYIGTHATGSVRCLMANAGASSNVDRDVYNIQISGDLA